jgi:hypothetical protein
MSSKVLPVILTTSLLVLAACASDDQPDARIPTPPRPADAALPDAADTTPDAADTTPDAPGTADATAVDGSGTVDAPSTVDASTVDGPGALPDAATVDAASPDAPVVVDAPAVVVLNEVAPNIASQRDLIELLVVQGGSTRDIRVLQNYGTSVTTLARLPDISVATNDLIVVHLNAVAGVTTETTGRGQCDDDACYPGAWDVRGEGDANIGYSYRVLVVRAANDAVLDAVPFMQNTDLGGGKPALFPGDLAALIGDDIWQTACAAPCDYTDLPAMYAATVNWSSAGTSPTGNTVQRKAGPVVNEHKVTDWDGVKAQTLGRPNDAQ